MDTTTTRRNLESLKAQILRNERGTEAQDIREERGELILSVRYFGNWEVPEDAEDDGDYDWKIPTTDTRRRLDSLVAAFQKQIPGLTWQNEGEKCWIAFIAPATK
jgi:hypothetical protein